MSNGAVAGGAAGGGAAAAAAAMANAVKASGAIVKVQQTDFMTIAAKSKQPLIVMAEGGLFSKNYQYLTAYKGLIFYTKVSQPLQLPSDAELIHSKKIWIPG
ncbi:MAG: hypothetical protein GF313_04720 [Caldithrix sp.]|nr:hypothetical protein [Caldithrix sp.]